MQEFSRRDLGTGLFVLAAIGVLVGALIVTSGVLVRRYEIYLRTASAQDLTQDTRVLLQGLAVGRVRQVNPVLDSLTGQVSFVARLAIDAEFPDGNPVVIPQGTRAVIEQLNPIAPPVIQLEVPAGGRRPALRPGDTLSSERRQGAVDVLGRVATELSDELRQTIRQAQALLRQSTQVALHADQLVRASSPRVDAALGQLTASLERANRLVADLAPRVAPLADSLTAVLADTRQALQHASRLAATVESLAGDNRQAMRQTIQHLQRSAELLEHFADQVSRRPTRLLTGVTPPPPPVPDTGRKQP